MNIPLLLLLVFFIAIFYLPTLSTFEWRLWIRPRRRGKRRVGLRSISCFDADYDDDDDDDDDDDVDYDDDDDDDTSPSRQHFGSWAPSTVETMRSIFANSNPTSHNPNPNPPLIFSVFQLQVLECQVPNFKIWFVPFHHCSMTIPLDSWFFFQNLDVTKSEIWMTEI